MKTDHRRAGKAATQVFAKRDANGYDDEIVNSGVVKLTMLGTTRL